MQQPETLDEIAEVIGYTKTATLAFWFGNQNLYIPQRFKPDHPLVSIVGAEAFRKLVDEFGGIGCLYIADSLADARIARYKALLAAGDDLKAAAAATGLGVRRAQQIVRRLRENGLDEFFKENSEAIPGGQIPGDSQI